MHGNVWEWRLDNWQKSCDGVPADCSAWLDGEVLNYEDKRKKETLLRGGSLHPYPRYCRSACRFHGDSAFASNIVGFRICCLLQD
jgi:formylglycine-generating enzyme required for sulfatase activity